MGTNRYGYSFNDPINKSDPSGHEIGLPTMVGLDNFSKMSQQDKAQVVDAAKSVSNFFVGDIQNAVENPSVINIGIAAVGLFSAAKVGKFVKTGYKAYKGPKTLKGKLKSTTSLSPIGSSIRRGNRKAVHVTKDGVALPPGEKYSIPQQYVQNPNRKGSYGIIVKGKFREKMRIDTPTPPGKKGPEYSHYHVNNKSKHRSPRNGNSDEGFNSQNNLSK